MRISMEPMLSNCIAGAELVSIQLRNAGSGLATLLEWKGVDRLPNGLVYDPRREVFHDFTNAYDW
jgi:hypothetical protein